MKRRVKRHTVVQPLDESYRFIPLTKRKNAIVDLSDYEWLSQWNWYCHLNYAVRKSNRKWVAMHRIILGVLPPYEVDHVNHNTLDNRRENLRKCTHGQNMCNVRKPFTNTSGYKGVRFYKNRWVARVSVGNREIYIGRYKTRIEAVRAWDKAARKYRGEFAFTNLG